MGLASSQARLLNLTARMHQIEYKAARLEAMKLQMANESTRVYEDYLDALDKAKVQKKTLTKDGSVTYTDITSYSDFTKAGFALVYNEKVYDGRVPITGYTKDGVTYTKDANGKFMGEVGGEKVELTDFTGATEIRSGDKLDFNKLVKDIINEHGNNTVSNVSIQDSADFETALQNVINSGWVTIVATNGIGSDKENAFPDPSDTLEFAKYETSVATNTGLQEVTDEIALRKAEAKYEADMKAIDLKDRKYDTDLAALDTERNAIKQEMETLKTVAKDNVERTFKIFS